MFTADAVANVLGLLPITPGGVGVVEGVPRDVVTPFSLQVRASKG